MAHTVQFGQTGQIDSATAAVDFPKPFSSVPVVLVTPQEATSGGLRNVEVQNVSKTSFDVRFGLQASCKINWLAISD